MDKTTHAKQHPTLKPKKQLQDNWTLIEKYQSTTFQSAANYSEDTHTLPCFSTLAAFAALWKHTTYSNPSELFFDLQRNRIRKITCENGDQKTVDGLYLFKNGIQPKWEDPANEEGSSLIVEFTRPTKEEVDTIWRDVVFSLIGGTFPHSECVNGLRMLDRLKKHKVVKFEVWVSVGVKKWKKGSGEYEMMSGKIDDIIGHFHRLFNVTVPMSVHTVSTKDHFVANKNK